MKQNRPLLLLPSVGSGPATVRLAWAAVVAALLVALVGVVAFVGSRPSNDLSVVPPSQSPSATSEPSASAEATATVAPSDVPSESPSGEPSASPEPIQQGIATVLVDSLRVRSEPGVGADSQLLTPLLGTGQSVYVVRGSVDADGYTWYAIAPRDAAGRLMPGLPKGWVAIASRDGEPWLSDIDVAPCPAGPPTVEALLALADGARCFGNADITVRANPAAVDVDGGWCFSAEDSPNCRAEPQWLIEPRYAVHAPGWTGFGPLFFAAAAPGAQLAEWSGAEETFEITGHFADAAASTCRIYDIVTDEPIVKSPEEVLALCTNTFAVTKAVPVGS